MAHSEKMPPPSGGKTLFPPIVTLALIQLRKRGASY